MRRAWFLFALALASCERIAADDGRDALFQVEGAQFVRGDMPSDRGGPAVKQLALSPRVQPGTTDRSCSGAIDREGTAVALAMANDRGYWIVPAGAPELAAPDLPTFRAKVSYAANVPLGERQIFARAVSEGKQFGPAKVTSVTIASAIPAGRLVVSLSWDNTADLDLHVVDALGVEVFARNPSSYEPPPPGSPPEPPNTPHDGGILDFDSNGQCVRDGRRRENVVWADPPPKGHYLVRVETSALCGEPAARWRVEAFLEGKSVGAAEGQSLESDTVPPHGRGAGRLALEFDVP